MTEQSWHQTVEGSRATIIPLQDLPPGVDWFDEAAQAIAGRSAPCKIEQRLSDGDLAWWIYGDDHQVGALCGRLATASPPSRHDVLIWTWLAIDARWRAFGYGGAAVPLLEQAAREAGAQAALVPLPPDNGVALYFWLRLGYTPLREVALSPDQRPSGVAADALWMQRPLV